MFTITGKLYVDYILFTYQPRFSKAILTKTDLLLNKEYAYIEHIVPETINKSFAGKVLVGFSEIGSGLESVGFGERLAEKLGISYIKVNQLRGSQYQYLTRDEFSSTISSISGSEELFFYGTSLGGYCAAYYARPVGANFLALSPRIPAHPVTNRRLAVKFKSPGFMHDYVYEGDAKEYQGAKQHVLLDRGNSVDNFYVETDLRLAFEQLAVHDVPFAGHYVPRALLLCKQLKRVVTQFLSNQEIEFSVDQKSIILWHQHKMLERISEKKYGHASEHLEVLVRACTHDQYAPFARKLNDAMLDR